MEGRVYTERNSAGPIRNSGRRSDGPSPYMLSGRADAVSSWGHDLFDPLSSLYAPAINTARLRGMGIETVEAPAPSPRPPSHRTSVRVVSEPSPRSPAAAAAASPTTKPVTKSLLQRMSDGKGGSTLMARIQGAAFLGRVDRSIEGPPPQQQPKPSPPVKKKPAAGIKGLAKASAEKAQAPSKPVGTLVVVKNLVNGTTADDVKAAFSDFGEILECKVQRMPGTDLYAANIHFRQHAEAQTARDTLNGVLADGEKLEVEIVNYTETVLDAPKNGSRSTGPADLASRLGAPSRNRSTPQERAAMLSGAPIESKMRSDDVLRYDSRASIITVDPNEPTRGRPSERRKGRFASGGGGGGRRSNGMEVD